jgi:hypothetical protein
VQCGSFNSELLPEDGLVRLKLVAVECNFYDFFKKGEFVNDIELH